MKGGLFWLIFWVFVTLAVTLVIIVWQGPAILSTADQAIKLSATYKGVQIAGAINGLQGAPTGTTHVIAIPKDGRECVTITANSVKITLRQSATIALVETEPGNASVNLTEPIDCSRHRKLRIEKLENIINIRPEA